MKIGLGAGPLGGIDRSEATRLIHAALDLGITLFDTAPSYGHSEDVLGEALEGRDVERVTKGGYGVEGVPDWTPAVIEAGIDRALRVLRTDCLGAFLFHSCPADVLARGDLVAPLVRAKEAGKVRQIGYSGDADGLAFAKTIPEFDVLECSVSILDREALATPTSKRLIAKRALANTPWIPRPEREDVAEYMRRYAKLRPSREDIPDEELFIRFAAHAPGVDCALVGTTRIAHLEAMVRDAAKGPLPADALATLDWQWRDHGADWRGLI